MLGYLTIQRYVFIRNTIRFLKKIKHIIIILLLYTASTYLSTLITALSNSILEAYYKNKC